MIVINKDVQYGKGNLFSLICFVLVTFVFYSNVPQSLKY